MRVYSVLCFSLCVIIAAFTLHWFPYDESRVAGLRLERLWGQDQSQVQNQILNHCDSIQGTEQTHFQRKFLSWLSPQELGKQGSKTCQLFIHGARNRLFLFKTLWVVNLRVNSPVGEELLSRQYQLETPRPLCFLPFLVFLLALLFNLKVFNMWFLVPTYLLFIAGANVLQLTNIATKTLLVAITHEQTFLGFALIILWLSFLKERMASASSVRIERHPVEGTINRAISAFAGLWNPVLYTLLGRFLFPPKGKWLSSFLDSQFLWFCLSLYLLRMGFGNFQESVLENLLLPRYFTYAVVAYYLTNFWLSQGQKQRVLWNLPQVWRPIGCVALVESLRFFSPFVQSIPSITRIGLALALSEVVWPIGVKLREVFRNFLPWVSILVLCSFLAVISYETGLIDLALVLLNPRVHPRFLSIFTFLAGMGVGFITGTFSLAFFTLFEFLKSPPLPLMRAALLDGLIAGCLVSPFSIFNLMPAIQFKVSVRQILSFRYRQIIIPLGIGLLIYLVGSLYSVAILRPVTFVFCILVAVAYQLKRRSWRIRKMQSLLSGHT